MVQKTLENVSKHLQFADIWWLQVKERKALIYVKNFQDWLFGSEYFQWRKALNWFSEDTNSFFEREWDFRQFQIQIT